MPRIIIYTIDGCPYCVAAKGLLERKGMAYEEHNLTDRPAERAKLAARAGGRTTVPQIWIGDTHVGGCDDLYDLDRRGRLDAMLLR